MLRIFILLFFFTHSLVFAASISKTFSTNFAILPIIIISETKSLTSPLEQIGQTKNVVVKPNDVFAASFNASGAPNLNFTRTVTQTSINMKTGTGTGNSQKIAVDNFTFSGPTSFDASGNALGIKVGATFHIKSNNIAGSYTGTATLRLVYL